MKFDSEIHHRRSIRFKGFDYAQSGMYFITICTHNRSPLFGHVANGKMQLSDAGVIASNEWLATAKMRFSVSVDEFVIMPNHIHGIIAVGAHCMRPGCTEMKTAKSERVQRAPTIGDMVRGYKSSVTKRINESSVLAVKSVWQRNYYEHIIRDETSYLKIAEYIQTNPQRWVEDTYHV